MIIEVIEQVLILLLAVKAGEYGMRLLGQPGIAGQLLGGVAVGPALLGWVEPTIDIKLLAEIGLVLLLFHVGLENPLSMLRDVGSQSFSVGLFGFIVPGVTGFVIGLALSWTTSASLFLAAALVATSIGVTTAILREMGQHGTRGARVILGAAVVDDILAMLLLATIVAVGNGAGGASAAISSLGIALIFIAGVLLLAGPARKFATPIVARVQQIDGSPIVLAFISALALALAAEKVGLAVIVGAFLAGVVIGDAEESEQVMQEVRPLEQVFAPFFFGLIGLKLTAESLVSVEVMGAIVGLSIVAVLTKAVPAYLAARKLDPQQRQLVAWGMVPRGEVGIIVAGLGTQTGQLSDSTFSVLVGMSLLTTLVAPFGLRYACRPRSDTAAA